MYYGIKVRLKILLIVSKVIIVTLIVVNGAAILMCWWNHCLMLTPSMRIWAGPRVEICSIWISLPTIAATPRLCNRQLLLFDGRLVVFIMWGSSEGLVLVLIQSLALVWRLHLLLFLQVVIIIVVHNLLARLSHRLATVVSHVELRWQSHTLLTALYGNTLCILWAISQVLLPSFRVYNSFCIMTLILKVASCRKLYSRNYFGTVIGLSMRICVLFWAVLVFDGGCSAS